MLLTLEEQMHVTLFKVDKKNVVPTKKADNLYFHAKLLQSQLVFFDELTSAVEIEQEGQITLYYDAMLPIQFMGALSQLMQQKFSKLNLVWKALSWSESLENVSENVSDVAFFTTAKRQFPNVKIDACILGAIKLGIYAGKESPLLVKDSVSRLDLRTNRQIITHSFLDSRINDYLRYAAHYIAVDNNKDVCELLEQGGWAILPEYYAREALQADKIAPLKVDFVWNDLHLNFAAFHNKNAHQSPTIEYLLSLLPALSKTYF
ncbi:LysR substrate-binding domain-containing protein [Psychromonas sp. MME1]|uniref:LysR substrate-binding domain-containing protein n=1 Tax=Psychromonas sp. MME1 TaxID=3231032 RepID=UPI0034E27DB0